MNADEEPAPDLEEARRKYARAFAEYLAARRQYRAGEITDAEFLKARKASDDAEAALTQIERENEG